MEWLDPQATEETLEEELVLDDILVSSFSTHFHPTRIV